MVSMRFFSSFYVQRNLRPCFAKIIPFSYVQSLRPQTASRPQTPSSADRKRRAVEQQDERFRVSNKYLSIVLTSIQLLPSKLLSLTSFDPVPIHPTVDSLSCHPSGTKSIDRRCRMVTRRWKSESKALIETKPFYFVDSSRRSWKGLRNARSGLNGRFICAYLVKKRK